MWAYYPLYSLNPHEILDWLEQKANEIENQNFLCLERLQIETMIDHNRAALVMRHFGSEIKVLRESYLAHQSTL